MRTGKGTRTHGGVGGGRLAHKATGLFHTGRKAGAACQKETLKGKPHDTNRAEKPSHGNIF